MMDYKLQNKASDETLEFSLDEETGRISGRDAAQVQNLVDETYRWGFCGTPIPCLSWHDLPPTPNSELLALLLYDQWDIEGHLEMPRLDASLPDIPGLVS